VSAHLRVLMIEDTPADFLLIKRHLRKEGVEADFTCVDSVQTLERAFTEGEWDILLSDYNIPGMNVGATLAEVVSRFPDLPIIIVSGTIGEARAVDLLKAGVADFVLKDDLARLVPSVQRAIREVINRRELRLEQCRQRHLIENISHGIVLVDADGKIFLTNPAFDRMFGYESGELCGQTIEVLVCEEYRERHIKRRMEYIEKPSTRVLWARRALTGRRKDGSRFPIEISLNPFQEDGRKYVQANVNDITERARVERDLRIAATVFEVQEGVVVTDRNNRILRVNRAFTEITGYTEEEVIGQDPSILKSGLDGPERYREMWRTLLRDKHWAGELRDKHKNGHIYPKWLNISVVTDEKGEITNYVGVFSDLTRLKQADEAVAANVAKSEFLANMSHELRTPMNGVVGMADILQETHLKQDQRRMVRTIRDSSLALLSILDEILDFSKIEAGKLAIESIPTCLHEVAEEVARLLVPNVSAKEIDFHLFVSPELPQWIVSDPLRLRQIMFNLVGNAIKFTSNGPSHTGRVMLWLEPVMLKDDKPALSIKVIDNGIGIRKESLASLFDPFTQADNTTTRRFGGTGLGLSITKRLVDMMQGNITVDSTPGVETKFVVTLPMNIAAPSHPTPLVADLRGIKLLALITDQTSGEIIQTYLDNVGAEVVVTSDFGEACRMLRQSIGWSGLVLDSLFVAEAASKPECCTLPWIQLGRWVGVDGSDEKSSFVRIQPILYYDLMQGVEVACGKVSVKRAVEKSDRRRRPRLKSLTIEEAVSRGNLVLLAEDNDINRDVIQQQLTLLGYASEAVGDGEAALEKWRSGRYAMLLTDGHMPKMDGFQLAAAIRQEQDAGKHFPIVIVTANAMKGEAERCLANGIDGYLTKPLRLNELGTMMARYLPLVPENQATPLVAETLDENDSVLVWDRNMLTQLVGDQPELHRQLLEKFSQHAEEKISTLSLLAEKGETNLMVDVAHKLKSAALSVGAMRMGEYCQQIESAGRRHQTALLCKLANQLNAAYVAFKDTLHSNVHESLHDPGK